MNFSGTECGLAGMLARQERVDGEHLVSTVAVATAHGLEHGKPVCAVERRVQEDLLESSSLRIDSDGHARVVDDDLQAVRVPRQVWVLKV